MSDNAEIDIAMPEEPVVDDPLEGEDYQSPDEDAEDGANEPELIVKEIVPDDNVFLGAKEQAAPKKEKVKKPRKPPSEKQLAHLAKIRVKALEAKKAKQAPKKVIKMKVAEIQEDYEEVEEPKGVNKVGKIEGNGGLVNLSQDDLRRLQYDAIHGYDTMRKQRKEEKKVRVAKEQQEKQVYATISKAVNPSADDAWGICFQ